MRIGIDARLVGYRRGGISTYILQLVEAFDRLGHGEHFTLLCGRKSRFPGLRASRFRTDRLWTPPHHPLEQWTLPVELALRPVDVLHCPDFIPPFRRRCRAVITVHDLAFLKFPEAKDQASLRYYRQTSRAVAEAEGIIAVTEATRQDLGDLLGVPRERVRVIHHGIASCFRPLPDRDAVQEFCRAKGLPESFILWVGTIEPRKNLAALLQAVQRMAPWMPGSSGTLVVAGERGWRDEGTWALLRKLEGEGLATYFGPAEQEDLLMLYNAAWVFAFPSLYEGFGLPPLEAMACGSPVVASDTPALREVLAGAAVFVEPDDVDGLATQLMRLAEEPEERQSLREAGLVQAGQFHWDKTAAETLGLYREVLAT